MEIDYQLKPSGGEPTVWAFDLGKASIGEAVRQGNRFLHKASQNISTEFKQDKTAKREVWRFCLRNAFEQVYPHGG